MDGNWIKKKVVLNDFNDLFMLFGYDILSDEFLSKWNFFLFFIEDI